MQPSLLAPRGIAQGSAASRTSCFRNCSSSLLQACRPQLRRSFRGCARLPQEVSNGAKCSAFFKLGGQTSSGGGEPASIASATPEFYLRARLHYRKNAMELCPFQGIAPQQLDRAFSASARAILDCEAPALSSSSALFFGIGPCTVGQEMLIRSEAARPFTRCAKPLYRTLGTLNQKLCPQHRLQPQGAKW